MPLHSSLLSRFQRSHKPHYDSIYEPLPAGEFLRVVKLYPGRYDDEIKCSLDILPLEATKNKYEAISYVWGSAADTVKVKCNGLRVPVTTNLADALRNFRHILRTRTLWIDGLCINQLDTLEKGSQVKKMGDIFANAERVLVWLGRDTTNIAADAFKLICDTSRYFDKEYTRSKYDLSRMARLEEPYPICVDEAKWKGVKTLFDSLWFSRVWVVQEAVVAKECTMFWGAARIDIADVLELCVWCGNKDDFSVMINNFEERIDYLRPISVIEIYTHYSIQTERHWRNSRPALKVAFATNRERGFLSVLSSSRKLKATDPRDHIYAFLGCPYAKDSNGKLYVEADYTISTDQLHINIACTMLQHAERGPWVLSNVQHRSRTALFRNKQPSWVPRWDKYYQRGKRITNVNHSYRAGGDYDLFSAEMLDQNVLKVAGSIFDTVLWISDRLNSDDFQLRSQYWSPDILKNGEPYIETLWKTVSSKAAELGIILAKDAYDKMLYMQNNGSVSMEVYVARLRAYERVIRCMLSRPIGKAAITPEDKYEAARLCAGHFKDIHNLRLIMTERGELGLVPVKGVEAGDLCCIFRGAPVPFIVTPETQGRHKLVGEFYLHSVMDGQMMEGVLSSNANGQHILIE